MKVVLDTNVYVSFLLMPTPDRVPTRILAHGLKQRFQLCVCCEQIDELVGTVAANPSLAERIGIENPDTFMTRLHRNAHVMNELPLATPSVVRDAKDDYLIAHAIAVNADLLVSGDKDLLVLERVRDVGIVSPAEFVVLLELIHA